MKPALADIELAGLFDNLATAILLLDRDGRIAFVNASAQVLLESSATRLVGSQSCWSSPVDWQGLRTALSVSKASDRAM